VSRPLSADELFPAGSTAIAQRFITLATGVRVRVAESGPRNGEPVLMLPGWCCTVYMYRHAFDELARRGMRAIAVDLRGFGLSDRPDVAGAYSLDAYLADLAALLDALDLKRVALVGQSMGGGVALHFALRNPERVERLVLINPTGLVPLRFLPLIRMLPRALTRLMDGQLAPRLMVSFILRRLAYGDPRMVTERDVDEYWSPTQLPGAIRAARAALSEFDWRPVSDAEASGLATPSMVILGRADRLIGNNEASARRLPGAAVQCLPGGHCVHEEHPRDAYRLIAEFVNPEGV